MVPARHCSHCVGSNRFDPGLSFTFEDTGVWEVYNFTVANVSAVIGSDFLAVPGQRTAVRQTFALVVAEQFESDFPLDGLLVSSLHRDLGTVASTAQRPSTHCSPPG